MTRRGNPAPLSAMPHYQAQRQSASAPPQSSASRVTPSPFIQPKAEFQELPEWQQASSYQLDILNLNRAPIQAKLTIGEPNDKYEQEADQVAAEVVQRMNEPEAVQREDLPEEEELQMKPEAIQRELPEDEELQMKPQLQRQVVSGGVSPELEQSLNRAKSGGQALDPQIQAKMGQAMGADFSGVKVHTDSRADQLNQSIQAKAFTTGKDLFFKQGEYNPGSRSGQELLAHELTHVVQQGGAGVQRHSDKDEIHRKPDIQRHDDEDEIHRKFDIQRHNDEDEIHRKFDSTSRTSGVSNSCQCSSCGASGISIQRQVESGKGSHDLLNRRLEDTINIQRTPESGGHCTSCPCTNCTGGSEKIQRQAESTHGPSCSCPSCGGGDRLQAKFLSHSSAAQDSGATSVHESASVDVIQRHSSWEHQLLGDADPRDLAKMGAWQDLIQQTEKQGGLFRRHRQTDKAVVHIPDVGEITKGNVMHVIAQELQRLDQWQRNPPQRGSSGDIDPTYETVLVSLPGGKDANTPLIITYGELNTLADYYGSLDAMKTADPESRYQLVQSVRQETFFRLKEIYTKLKKSLTSREGREDQDIRTAEGMMGNNSLVNQKLGFKFKGAITPDYISGKAGQVELLKGIQKTGAQGDTNEYAATLARNACHFVPESWHAWSSYHQKARIAAQNAYNFEQRHQDVRQQMIGNPGANVNALADDAHDLKLSQQEAANEAILSNGFGDHYLQDSYAGGHMINKTKIMQWFVQWLDTQKWTMDFARDDNWRKVQAIAYKQPELASQLQYNKNRVQGYVPAPNNQQVNRAQNPQAVEDIGGDDWTLRFEALNLTVPRSLRNANGEARRLMQWWQGAAAQKKKHAKLSGKALQLGSGLGFAALKVAIENLIADVVIHTGDSSAKIGREVLARNHRRYANMEPQQFDRIKFTLRSEYIPKDLPKFIGAAVNTGQGNDRDYRNMAKAVTYQDYMAFMNHGYVQKSTNALHDVFCKQGLLVNSGRGEALFRAYGDDSMFNAGSSFGVKHSGETAHMSRDAIRNIITTGNDGGITTARILNRLPSQVQSPTDGSVMSIEDWHDPSQQGNLKTYCEEHIFPNMGLVDKAVGVMGDVTKFLSKDKGRIHGREAF